GGAGTVHPTRATIVASRAGAMRGARRRGTRSVCPRRTRWYARKVATGVRMGHHRGATDHGSGRTPGPRRHPYESVKGVPVSSTFNLPLADVHPEVAEALALELGRQRSTLEMIASENFVPRAVLEAQGSVLTNKYAEGYPGKRYYGGCEFVDVIEQLAIDRAKALFGAEHANVQPHAGAQ